MDDAVFKEIANEIKGFNNKAIRLISQGKFDDAEAVCKRGLEMSQTLSYYDGMAMFFFNLANMETVRGDLLKAMTYGALCREMNEKAQTDTESCDKLMKSLAKSAMMRGMEHEKKGELKEALEYYYAGAPFSEEKYRMAMLGEIELIKRVISDGQGIDRENKDNAEHVE
ncbi:MAG: hypothetical protein LBH28_06640 [Oscillospiraceae bacterium]|jgi:tetratricopeptide (TPR) repeat protein|nr:hypothetical protein [Oscillospiraceae bacterium]